MVDGGPWVPVVGGPCAFVVGGPVVGVVVPTGTDFAVVAVGIVDDAPGFLFRPGGTATPDGVVRPGVEDADDATVVPVVTFELPVVPLGAVPFPASAAGNGASLLCGPSVVF